MPTPMTAELENKTLVAMYRKEFEHGHVPCDEPPGFEERAYRLWKEQGGAVKFLDAREAAALARAYGSSSVRAEAVDAMYEMAQAMIAARAIAGERYATTSSVHARIGPKSAFADKFGVWSMPEWHALADRLRAKNFLVFEDKIHW